MVMVCSAQHVHLCSQALHHCTAHISGACAAAALQSVAGGASLADRPTCLGGSTLVHAAHEQQQRAACVLSDAGAQLKNGGLPQAVAAVLQLEAHLRRLALESQWDPEPSGASCPSGQDVCTVCTVCVLLLVQSASHAAHLG